MRRIATYQDKLKLSVPQLLCSQLVNDLEEKHVIFHHSVYTLGQSQKQSERDVVEGGGLMGNWAGRRAEICGKWPRVWSPEPAKCISNACCVTLTSQVLYHFFCGQHGSRTMQGSKCLEAYFRSIEKLKSYHSQHSQLVIGISSPTLKSQKAQNNHTAC